MYLSKRKVNEYSLTPSKVILKTLLTFCHQNKVKATLAFHCMFIFYVFIAAEHSLRVYSEKSTKFKRVETFEASFPF